MGTGMRNGFDSCRQLYPALKGQDYALSARKIQFTLSEHNDLFQVGEVPGRTGRPTFLNPVRLT
jgi:hypothetical protein